MGLIEKQIFDHIFILIEKLYRVNGGELLLFRGTSVPEPRPGAEPLDPNFKFPSPNGDS